MRCDRRQRRGQPGRPGDRIEPIYGMPIINADKAKTVMVLKRSMAPGFAGVENPLFVKKYRDAVRGCQSNRATTGCAV